METTNPLPQPALAPAPAFAAPATVQPTAADMPPWLEDDVEPAAAPMRRLPRKAQPVGRSQAEAVHWGVGLLTLFTAASVLFGSRGGEITHSRELLPVMITTVR